MRFIIRLKIMGDYSRARKIYSSGPPACIHTLEPAPQDVRLASMKYLPAMSRKIEMEYYVGVPEFEFSAPVH
jgi:hypothetical protein